MEVMNYVIRCAHVMKFALPHTVLTMNVIIYAYTQCKTCDPLTQVDCGMKNQISYPLDTSKTKGRNPTDFAAVFFLEWVN